MSQFAEVCFAGVCLVSAMLATSAPTDPPRFGADCNSTDIAEKDIQNFHQVDAYLYRGARPKCSGYQKLARMGVRTIVSLQGDTEKSLAGCHVSPERPGFHFRFISFDVNFVQTGLTGISSEDLQRLFRAMRDAPKPIFVDCRYGKDRTGAVVAIYRMKEREMSFEQAKRELSTTGSGSVL